jgi:hypothetical protein
MTPGRPGDGAAGSFGFTGKLQRGSDGWLRARWYGAGRGSFASRDPFEGVAETPYSMLYYQYGYSNLVSNSSPASAPRSRWIRYLDIGEVDNPWRRSSSPRRGSPFGYASYSVRMVSRCTAVHRLGRGRISVDAESCAATRGRYRGCHQGFLASARHATHFWVVICPRSV